MPSLDSKIGRMYSVLRFDLIVESIPCPVIGLSLRFILKSRYPFSMFQCTPSAHSTGRSPIFKSSPLSSGGIILLEFFWNFPAIADKLCEFRTPFLAHTNDALDQLYCNLFIFCSLSMSLTQKSLCNVCVASESTSSKLSADVCFNVKLQQLGEDVLPKMWRHIRWSEGSQSRLFSYQRNLMKFCCFFGTRNWSNIHSMSAICPIGSCLNLINTPMT